MECLPLTKEFILKCQVTTDKKKKKKERKKKKKAATLRKFIDPLVTYAATTLKKENTPW